MNLNGSPRLRAPCWRRSSEALPQSQRSRCRSTFVPAADERQSRRRHARDQRQRQQRSLRRYEDAPSPEGRAELRLHPARRLCRGWFGAARLRRRRHSRDQRPRSKHAPSEADLHLDHQFLTTPSENPPDPLVVAPNGSALFLVYDVLLPNGAPGEAFVDRWRLQTGKLEATVGVGAKGARAAALVAGGRRLLIAGASQLTVLDAATLKRARTVQLPPGPMVAIRPDGRVAAVGSEAGSISFVDLSTGRVAPGLGGIQTRLSGASSLRTVARSSRPRRMAP